MCFRVICCRFVVCWKAYKMIFNLNVLLRKSGLLISRGHIPLSLNFDIHRCVTRTPEIPRNLPDLNCFTDYVQDLGIHPETHVVAYDRFGPVAAYRTWWLFRVRTHIDCFCVRHLNPLSQWAINQFATSSNQLLLKVC